MLLGIHTNLLVLSALVGEFLRKACCCFLYKDFNEEAMELLNTSKHRGYNPSGVEKYFPKSFEWMKKRQSILEKIVMKFILNFIFKLES